MEVSPNPLAELVAWWSEAYDDGGAGTIVETFTHAENSVRVAFRTGDDAGAHARWTLSADGCSEILWDEKGSELEWFADHVLLAQYLDRRSWISFTGAIDRPQELLGALLQAHEAAWNDWLPLKRYFRPSMLDSRFGIIAEGPERILDIYEEELSRFGIHIHRVTRDPEPPRRPSPTVVTIGRSYLVADSFLLKRDE